MRLFFILTLLFSLSQAKMFLLPQEAKKAQNEIIELIDDSKKSITIAMYNFSYGKFAKALVRAKKRGLEIKVILDAKKIKEKNSEYYYLKNNGIEPFLAKKKMHLKVAIFDNKKIVFGSTNWTKASFSKNHEFLIIEKNKKYIKKMNNHLYNLLKE